MTDPQPVKNVGAAHREVVVVCEVLYTEMLRGGRCTATARSACLAPAF